MTTTYSPMRPVMTAEELAIHRSPIDCHGRDYRLSTDGYGDMAVARARGWETLSCWGSRGWDLGDWPYVSVAVRTLPESMHSAGSFMLSTTVEGDTDVYRFDTLADRDAAIDYLFIWYGLRYSDRYDEWVAAGLVGEDKRAALDAGALTIPLELRGPYRG